MFKLPSLQHAGLGYNAIAELPRHLLPTCSSLLSLDISHNSLEDMEQAFADLDSLPSLQVRCCCAVLPLRVLARMHARTPA